MVKFNYLSSLILKPMKYFIFLLLAVGLILPAPVLAARLEAGDQFIIPAGESVSGNTYVASGNVNLAGQVVGDLYTAAGTNAITGQVTDDVAVIGGNTVISGHVGGDVRVIGGQVVITGSIGGDVLVMAGSLTLSGAVLGDVDFIGGRLVITETGTVGGGVTYRSDRRAQISEQAVIAGDITYDQTLAEKLGLLKEAGSSAAFKSTLLALFGAWLFLKLIMLIFAGLVLLWLLPEAVERISEAANQAPGRSLLIGFIAALLMPLLALVLLITVVGMPLALLIVLSYAGLMLLSALLSGLWLGAWLDHYFFKRRSWRFTPVTAISGIIILFLLSYLPVVGWLVTAGFTLLLWGAMLDLLYRRWRAW